MEENRPMDVLDILLDDDNHDNITLYDENEKPIEFEQVAVIPLGDEEDGELYCILKPAGKLEGIKDNEAIVFHVIEDEDGVADLEVELDDEIAEKVFEEFYKLCDELENK